MRAFVTDLVERVVWTYIEVFCGLLLVSWAAEAVGGQASVVADWSLVTKAALAAIPAAVAVVKNIAAGFIGNPDSAAAVPRGVDKKGLQYAPVPDQELPFHGSAKDRGPKAGGYTPVSDEDHERTLATHAARPKRQPRKRA